MIRTILFTKKQKGTATCSLLDHEMTALSEWLKVNKLSLNIDVTKRSGVTRLVSPAAVTDGVTLFSLQKVTVFLVIILK